VFVCVTGVVALINWSVSVEAKRTGQPPHATIVPQNAAFQPPSLSLSVTAGTQANRTGTESSSWSFGVQGLWWLISCSFPSLCFSGAEWESEQDPVVKRKENEIKVFHFWWRGCGFCCCLFVCLFFYFFILYIYIYFFMIGELKMLGMRISILLCWAWFLCPIIRELGKCQLLDLVEMVKKWFFLLSLVIWKNPIIPGRVILSVCCVLQISGKKFGGIFLSRGGLRHFLCQIGLLGCYLCYWECFWRRLFVVTLFGGWFWIMGFVVFDVIWLCFFYLSYQ
jgi:hypothetical protein